MQNKGRPEGRPLKERRTDLAGCSQRFGCTQSVWADNPRTVF